LYKGFFEKNKGIEVEIVILFGFLYLVFKKIYNLAENSREFLIDWPIKTD
jgi:hypothetical protein